VEVSPARRAEKDRMGVRPHAAYRVVRGRCQNQAKRDRKELEDEASGPWPGNSWARSEDSDPQPSGP
jgi:hypothetical protein